MISIVIISKDEPSLDETLTDLVGEAASLSEPTETIVVDASNNRLNDIRDRHATAVRWVDFQQPPGVRVSIPHQRNAGVREATGDIIVFTDAGCRLHPSWLASLVKMLRENENVVAGPHKDASGKGRYEGRHELVSDDPRKAVYLNEAPTLNFAFRRQVFDEVGGFDENLAYGSDVEFCWRVTNIGYRIRYVAEAIVEHDWGTPKRQRRRSYLYGKARARLYRKHRSRLKNILRNDPMVVLNPLFVLGLPIALIFPPYLLLLLIPAWWNKNRGVGGALRAVVDHLWYGAGVLSEIATTRVYAQRHVRESRLRQKNCLRSINCKESWR